MNKNLLSFAIIILAIAIVFINLWKPSESKENEKETIQTTSNEEVTPNTSVVESGVEEGNQAPDFELTSLSGETVKLSDYKGKKVILNFWATWCPPCKAEMPHMQKFYENNKDKGIEILAVNLTSMDKPDAIESFVKDYGLTFTIPLDEDGTIGQQYQAFTIPTSYIIDSNGVITTKVVGPMDENVMMNLTKDID